MRFPKAGKGNIIEGALLVPCAVAIRVRRLALDFVKVGIGPEERERERKGEKNLSERASESKADIAKRKDVGASPVSPCRR